MENLDIGLIGLAVMGENLVLNMESKGFSVAVYNRTVSKVDDFINGRAAGKRIKGCSNLKELAASLTFRKSEFTKEVLIYFAEYIKRGTFTLRVRLRFQTYIGGNIFKNLK